MVAAQGQIACEPAGKPAAKHSQEGVCVEYFLCSCMQPLARAAIQALKLFYVAQHDEGKLQSSNAKRQRVSTEAPASAAAITAVPVQRVVS